MPERKVWTGEEDKILKFLIQVRGLVKWSQISRVMQDQFRIQGRNGKQCRQRYHNHLAQNIKNQQWSLEEQDILFKLQDEIGNKWALISSNLPGRTDNCVKNHFYSKLRKNLRKINRKINKNFKKQYKEIKTTTLYKIIETLQNRNKLGQSVQVHQQTYELCRKIKNQLRTYEDQIIKLEDINEQLMYVRCIVEDIAILDKEVKKISKKENLKTSGKFSEIRSIQANKSSNVMSSTKSIYDDQSSFSNSNSEMLLESSYGTLRNEQTPQFVSSSNKIFRSQRIIPGKSIDPAHIEKAQILYNSVKIVHPKLKNEKKMMPQCSDEEGNSDQSHSLQKSSNSNSQRNFKYLMGQQFQMLNMNKAPILTLTASEIQQINKQNNQWLFGQQQMMIIDEQQMIVKDFQKINLTIPKLGKDYF